MSELNLIMLGPPGAGKGTQAQRLREDFRLPYIATGDMFRAEKENGTELGQEVAKYMDNGDLVPDDLTIKLIVERITSEEAKDGFILDGFPRTLPQAAALEAELARLGRSITAGRLTDAPYQEVIRGISGRRLCVKTPEHVYHVDFDPPKHEGKCDFDGARLVLRDDDAPEKVKHRLEVFHQQTKPLVEYYQERGLLRQFDGRRDKTEVHDHIRATLATLRLEETL